MKQFRPLDCLVCADRVFDFVQEMGDLKPAPKGVGVTQTISSLAGNLVLTTGLKT